MPTHAPEKERNAILISYVVHVTHRNHCRSADELRIPHAVEVCNNNCAWTFDRAGGNAICKRRQQCRAVLTSGTNEDGNAEGGRANLARLSHDRFRRAESMTIR